MQIYYNYDDLANCCARSRKPIITNLCTHYHRHDQIQSCVPFHVPVHHKVPGYMYFDPAFSTEMHKTNYGLQFVQALGFFYSFN